MFMSVVTQKAFGTGIRIGSIICDHPDCETGMTHVVSAEKMGFHQQRMMTETSRRNLGWTITKVDDVWHHYCRQHRHFAYDQAMVIYKRIEPWEVVVRKVCSDCEFFDTPGIEEDEVVGGGCLSPSQCEQSVIPFWLKADAKRWMEFFADKNHVYTLRYKEPNKIIMTLYCDQCHDDLLVPEGYICPLCGNDLVPF